MMHGYDDASLNQLLGAMFLYSKVAKYFNRSYYYIVNLCNNMTYSTRNLNPAKTLIGIPTKMNGDPLHEAGMLACEWEIHKIIKQLSSK